MDNTSRKVIIIEVRIPESEFKDWNGSDDEKLYEMKSDLRDFLKNHIRDFELRSELRQY